MSNKANPATLGSFIMGIILLAVVAIVFFGDQSFFRSTMRAVMMFDGSIKGLNVGAPVTLRGVKIGEVADVRLNIEADSMAFSTPVYVLLDTAKFKDLDDSNRDEMIKELTEKGLRAQLKLQSLLTGLLYIEMDFFPGSPADYKSTDKSVPELVTIPTDLQELSRTLQGANVGKMIADAERITAGLDTLINAPATQQLTERLTSALASVQTLADNTAVELDRTRTELQPLIAGSTLLMEDLHRQLPPALDKLNSALAQLDEAARSLEFAAHSAGQQFSDDSPLIYRLNRMATAVERSARSVDELAQTLERDPRAILRGREE
ncbi:MAG TPA: MlaD family protein [Spongiibacteraceae bacterium]|jgi:paraquat-inducible protein B|nr:MlaD family protein [Spongiibacteraceae bacterium]HUH38504.1 MlaD family protein [Spongiibacteraceae bacterium]